MFNAANNILLKRPIKRGFSTSPKVVNNYLLLTSISTQYSEPSIKFGTKRLFVPHLFDNQKLLYTFAPN